MLTLIGVLRVWKRLSLCGIAWLAYAVSTLMTRISSYWMSSITDIEFKTDVISLCLQAVQVLLCVAVGVMLLLCARGYMGSGIPLAVISAVGFVVIPILSTASQWSGLAALAVPIVIGTAVLYGIVLSAANYGSAFFLGMAMKKEQKLAE